MIKHIEKFLPLYLATAMIVGFAVLFKAVLYLDDNEKLKLSSLVCEGSTTTQHLVISFRPLQNGFCALVLTNENDKWIARKTCYLDPTMTCKLEATEAWVKRKEVEVQND